MSKPVYLAIALLLASQSAAAQDKPETARVVPQARQAPPSPRLTPARCEQMAKDLAMMRGALGSFPAPQRANIERQLVADERTYKQECMPK